MKRLLSIIICAAVTTALSSCSVSTEESGDTSALMSDLPDTSEVVSAENTISDTEKYSETEEAVTEKTETEASVREVSSQQEGSGSQSDENSTDETSPEISEFSMSLDGLNDYTRSRVVLARKQIKSMLDRTGTDEIPEINLRSGGWLPKVAVESWQVVDERYENYRYEVTVRLEVSESESEFITVGTDDYLILYQPHEDRKFLPFRKVGEFDEEKLLPCWDDKRYLDFCGNFSCFFRKLFGGDVVTDFSEPDMSNASWWTLCNASQAAYWYYPGLGFCMTYDEFDEAMQSLYGFSADALGIKESNIYNAENDTINVPEKGTSWLYGYLADESFDEETGIRTATMEYYEDAFYLVPSQTYRYTVRENENGSYTMLKLERLFASDRGILSDTV